MGILDIFKKIKKPYKDSYVNNIYELLFCDYELYRDYPNDKSAFPWNVLFLNNFNPIEVNNIIQNDNIESRIKILAYRILSANGMVIDDKELLAVIVEVGLDDGLDVLASFKDGTARYINQSGKILIWENIDNTSINLTESLFERSNIIVNQIGPWNEPRRSHPEKGMVRISFLVSDKLYFGEGPIKILFNDELAGPALLAATYLMKYITEKSLSNDESI
ncbi:hypothetical protein [Mucilaginibacter aquatilis]|uniref:DUF3786 domain-containing protein n=1 Tax=Mucilaginibacter aquatilis TaxID=1517760 RepID=A0A6I4I662_9SPHI|nr:hypothetical protein [Mucilaginibacter aquatilis]MVN90552.1 hypothetical protein [Mucilaginibacter aquatilis]